MVIFMLIFLLIVAVIHYIPSIIAFMAMTDDKISGGDFALVLFVNTLFGWTGLGWFVVMWFTFSIIPD